MNPGPAQPDADMLPSEPARRAKVKLNTYKTIIHIHNYVNAVFPGRWIVREGPIPWTARSPDLNPLHYLNSLVFETTGETDMELVTRIVAAYGIIQNT